MAVFSLSNVSFNFPLTENCSVLVPQISPVEFPSPQKLAAEKYFGNVIDVLPNTLTGNFGEPRRLHFHTGLDFRTNQEEGHAVFAAADGFVSRINVSSGGYGNALYITHPNGYVTVYGHLQKFNQPVMKRLRKEQYTKESFAVDFYPKPGEIIVRKGDTIALSGNTGGSGGPHLHFEIRDSLERVYNPMLFGYSLKDNIKPVIGYLKFYPLDDLRYKCDGYRIRTYNQEGVYSVANGIVKLNSTLVGFSVNTYDIMNMTEAHVGVYGMKVFDGSLPIFEFKNDQLTFPERRYVLSHIDYPIFEKESRKIFHKCFVEPGNFCPMYSNVTNAGAVDLSDAKPHQIKIEVRDYAGNVSTIKFKLQYDKTSVVFKEKELKYTTRFDYDHNNEFSNSDVALNIHKGCLFDHVYFNYSSFPSADTTVFSKVHHIGDFDTQLFDWFSLSIKTENLNHALADKAVVVYKDKANSVFSRGGKFENGFITTRAREFGTYFVRLDTTVPKIKLLNIISGRNMRVYKKILVKISDNLSGVSDFDTYIDGKWVVTDYDSKSATLTHTLDQNLATGEHIFKVVVEDERKNKNEYSVMFEM